MKENISINVDEGNAIQINYTPEFTFDFDKLTQIDFNNIHSEKITNYAIFSKISLLKARAEANVTQLEKERKIFYAKQEEVVYKNLTVFTKDPKGNTKEKFPTKDQVNSGILRNSNYIRILEKLANAQSSVLYMESLYWASQNKQKTLEYLSSSTNTDSKFKL